MSYLSRPSTPRFVVRPPLDRPTMTWPSALGRLVAAGAVIAGVALALGFLVVGQHGGGLIQPWDHSVWAWFLHHRGGLVLASKVVAVAADATGLGVIVAVLTILLLASTRRIGITALMPLLGYLGGEALVFFVRIFIHRPRPITANYPAPGAIPGVHETSWSYTSGHATAGTAVLVALAGVIVINWDVWWPWVAAALLSMAVATSRLVLGVHWFSDVAFGMVLGGAWGVVLYLVFRHLSWAALSRRLARYDPFPRSLR